jgi:hypothetical protein
MAIVVQLELVLGFGEGGFGFRHSSSDLVAEFVTNSSAEHMPFGSKPI